MDYNKILNVDFRKLSILLTPIFWRKSIFVGFIYCLVEPQRRLNEDFKKFREKSIYKIVHNGQVILLEKALNDTFDKELRRIYITDSSQSDPVYLYSTAEQKPVYLGTQYLYDFSSFNQSEFEFIVNFPLELKPVNPFDLLNFENRIKALVNYYKLASKRYVIKWT